MSTPEHEPPPRRPTLGEALTFGIPFDRIILAPTPGTATAADVARVVAHEDRLCELVDGTLVERAHGWAESLLVADLSAHLGEFDRAERRGFLVGPKAPVQLRPGLVRAPDIAYYLKSSLPGGRLPDDPVAAIIPDLVVEVRRPRNSPSEMKRKANDFLKTGIRLVWVVEPRMRWVRVLEPGGRRVAIPADETLDGGPVLPGFRLRVGDLFDLGQYGEFGGQPEADASGTGPGLGRRDDYDLFDWDAERFRTSGPPRPKP